MNRYRLERKLEKDAFDNTYQHNYNFIEHGEGEWVRYEDVQELLRKQREAEIEAIKQFAREGHHATAEAIIQTLLNAEVEP